MQLCAHSSVFSVPSTGLTETIPQMQVAALITVPREKSPGNIRLKVCIQQKRKKERQRKRSSVHTLHETSNAASDVFNFWDGTTRVFFSSPPEPPDGLRRIMAGPWSASMDWPTETGFLHVNNVHQWIPHSCVTSPHGFLGNGLQSRPPHAWYVPTVILKMERIPCRMEEQPERA